MGKPAGGGGPNGASDQVAPKPDFRPLLGRGPWGNAMKYDAKQMAEENLLKAKSKLGELPIYSGKEPRIRGLNGWVFEQAVQYCLKKELAQHGLRPEVEEQVGIGGHAKADLRIGRLVIELKLKGLFGINVDKYQKYRKHAEAKGLRYLFLSAQEKRPQYKQAIIKVLGRTNVFLLDQHGDWRRFVSEVVKELKTTKRTSRGRGACPPEGGARLSL